MIQIAIIPPGALAEKYCEGRTMQMALAGELVHKNGGSPPDADYVNYYNQAWKSNHVQWLLDNGAWENSRLNTEDLLHVAARYGATELVAPDVIGNPYDTMELTKGFLEYLRETPKLPFGQVPRIAVVAHGQTLRESMAFVEEVSASDISHHVRTISISRTTCYRSGNPTARLELALAIKNKYQGRYDVHLLGFSDQWATEIQHCAGYPNLVRSCDTIAPFSYSYLGQRLEAVGRVEVPRPSNYFQLEADDFDLDLLEYNIKTLDMWARTGIQDWVRL